MNRDKRVYLSILIADLFVMAGAFFVLQDRWRLAHLLNVSPAGAPSFSPQAPAEPEEARPSQEQPRSNASSALRAPRSAAEAPRHILFAYRHSKPTRVELIGSFNGWKPRPMKKGADHVWSLNVPLSPGDYTYNFVVDGRVIRDPNNRRTAAEGRSLLTVKPREE